MTVVNPGNNIASHIISVAQYSNCASLFDDENNNESVVVRCAPHLFLCWIAGVKDRGAKTSFHREFLL